MKIIGPFKQVLPMHLLPLHGGIQDEEMHVLSDGGLLIDGERILEIADFEQLKTSHPQAKIEFIENPMVLLPGFVDCHTHICFAGNRAEDFAMRLNGKSYLEIATQGGGIWKTVTHTRKASVEELAEGIVLRAHKMLQQGITTIEVKSGYGLNKESEINMLKAIQLANKHTAADLIPTFLGAHMVPRDFEGNSKEYLDYCLREIIPTIMEEKLAQRADIFIEKTAFQKEESLDYLMKLKSLRFDLTVHADQFTSGGSKIAIQAGAVSADHLEASTPEDILQLSESNTAAVALPGASLGLGEPLTPARKLLDHQALLAIASDYNPGSAPMGDLLTQASILATYEKLSSAEVFAALTYRPAHILKQDKIGCLAKDFFADAVAFPTQHFSEILYHQGQLKPCAVWKKGLLVHSSV